ncbi:TIGR02391 family protein [Halalkalibaculum sp. DA384]|uniref:TIGR02391 family protein n=1 Tax=Halalkalibaculum sp. DA384 TaxID=3373606 RepID=UPI0037548718
MSNSIPYLTSGQTEQIAKILGDTEEGLTGSQIGQLLSQARIKDVDPKNTKWKRLFNAFANCQNKAGNSTCVFNFIHYALEPSRYVGRKDVFKKRQEEINNVLAFVGFRFSDNGKFVRTSKAKSLSEAEKRASQLREKLQDRDVHKDVLKFCKAELLEDNYFHAVLEATKSIASKLREKSGLDLDGSKLVDATLGSSSPIVLINSFQTKSEKSEQKGFLNLVKGLFGTFRNPTAHEARIEWAMDEADALDLLVTASYVHRRIDNSN